MSASARVEGQGSDVVKSSSLSRILYLISTIVPCIMGAALCVTIFALEVSDLRHEQARYREQCEQTARAVETLVDASDSALARRLVVQGSVSLGIALLFIAIGLVIARIASRRLRVTIDDLQSSLRGGVLDRRPILPTAMPYAELADLAGLANTMLEAREAANERWRKSEEQLHHAQKMESVARLLGGVVHDFNNLLTAIGGYSDLLATSVALDAEGQDFVAEIQKASSRAASLTQQLLAFSRKEPARKSLVDVNAVVMGMGRMCSRIVGESITLETHLCPGLCPVFMDASQLEQVLINLVVNSRDAIDGKGRISIETSAASAPLTRQGGWVVLSVRDSGCGMSDEVKRHLFEPYYTTKGQGKGTGLGLSIISSIVHQSEGFIDVDSRAGEGTVFRIHLPCHDGSDVPTEGRVDSAVACGRGERILVVDDDAAVRGIAASVLVAAGYTVVKASSGAEALAVLEGAGAASVHCLLVDVILPDMNGDALVARVRAGDGGKPVVRMSGYPASEIPPATVDAEEILAKPFSAATLLACVRAALDRAEKG